MPKVFIDGQVGTTGLQIADRLKERNDITILEIPETERKNVAIKKEYLNSADLVILCLPDAASMESVGLIENDEVKVLDASTAHRTNENWVYGLPELDPRQRQEIRLAKRVSNPGCYPTGFLLAVTPLVKTGILPKDYPVMVNAVSGYSGGGRKLIDKYREQEAAQPGQYWWYRKYGLLLQHKHVPEMTKYSGLSYPPLFEPAVAHFKQGMLVCVPMEVRLLKSGTTIEDVHGALARAYENEPFITVYQPNPTEMLDEGFLSPLDCNGTNRVDIFVFGSSTQLTVIARLDNLGKGASGAAVQNMNLMLGFAETLGLV